MFSPVLRPRHNPGVRQRSDGGRFRGPVLGIVDMDGGGAEKDSALAVVFEDREAPAEGGVELRP